MEDYIYKLDYAKHAAEKSKARRLKVGCAIIDTKDNIIHIKAPIDLFILS